MANKASVYARQNLTCDNNHLTLIQQQQHYITTLHSMNRVKTFAYTITSTEGIQSTEPEQYDQHHFFVFVTANGVITVLTTL